MLQVTLKTSPSFPPPPQKQNQKSNKILKTDNIKIKVQNPNHSNSRPGESFAHRFRSFRLHCPFGVVPFTCAPLGCVPITSLVDGRFLWLGVPLGTDSSFRISPVPRG